MPATAVTQQYPTIVSGSESHRYTAKLTRSTHTTLGAGSGQALNGRHSQTATQMVQGGGGPKASPGGVPAARLQVPPWVSDIDIPHNHHIFLQPHAGETRRPWQAPLQGLKYTMSGVKTRRQHPGLDGLDAAIRTVPSSPLLPTPSPTTHTHFRVSLHMHERKYNNIRIVVGWIMIIGWECEVPPLSPGPTAFNAFHYNAHARPAAIFVRG